MSDYFIKHKPPISEECFSPFIIVITFIVVPKNSNDNSLTGAINCQLTNIPTTNLLSQDLVSDSSWDIYQQEDDCNNGYHKKLVVDRTMSSILGLCNQKFECNLNKEFMKFFAIFLVCKALPTLNPIFENSVLLTRYTKLLFKI